MKWKTNKVCHRSTVQIEKSPPEGKRIMQEYRDFGIIRHRCLVIFLPMFEKIVVFIIFLLFTLFFSITIKVV